MTVFFRCWCASAWVRCCGPSQYNNNNNNNNNTNDTNNNNNPHDLHNNNNNAQLFSVFEHMNLGTLLWPFTIIITTTI